MTPWHYRWLCQFAYINLPSSVSPGQTLSEIAARLRSLHESSALPCGKLSPSDLETIQIIRADPDLSALVLLEYTNRNSSTGLVYFVLRAPDESLHLLFRGSESRGCGVPTGVDWLDNFLAPFHGSVQYPEIAALARRFPKARAVFSGHSKGAHNALYALASCPAPDARAVVFNGQGFAAGQLTRSQKSRLARHGVNYVTRGDPVGALLFHPEKRVFTRAQPGVHPHSLAAFEFDVSGTPRPGLRPLWSFALELTSRLAVTPQGFPLEGKLSAKQTDEVSPIQIRSYSAEPVYPVLHPVSSLIN